MGKVLQVCFDVYGLGNVSSTPMTVNYTATVMTECENKGGNVAPGLTRTIKGADTFEVSVSNGRAVGCVTTAVPAPGQCPSANMKGRVTDVMFTNVSISISGKTFKAAL